MPTWSYHISEWPSWSLVTICEAAEPAMKTASGETDSGGDMRIWLMVEGRSLDMLWARAGRGVGAAAAAGKTGGLAAAMLAACILDGGLVGITTLAGGRAHTYAAGSPADELDTARSRANIGRVICWCTS